MKITFQLSGGNCFIAWKESSLIGAIRGSRSGPTNSRDSLMQLMKVVRCSSYSYPYPPANMHAKEREWQLLRILQTLMVDTFLWIRFLRSISYRFPPKATRNIFSFKTVLRYFLYSSVITSNSCGENWDQLDELAQFE